MRYSRDKIRKRFESDMIVEPEAIGKWACHVYNGVEYITTIIGDTWEEVNEEYKRKYEEE